MACVSCGRGFHPECVVSCDVCHPADVGIEGITTPQNHQPKELKDEKSTGRKRAARLYPITAGADCEWMGHKNCGGGRRPIIGCYDGKQQHRHHGPVKKTTRNEQGNVHRICTSCHVRWHELNDLIYDEKDYGLLPHLPEKATDQEIISNDLEWKSGRMGKKFELASSKNIEKFKEKLEVEDAPHDSVSASDDE